MATTQTLDLCGVLRESKKIMKSHSRHFLALSVLFLLPLSFSLTVYPTLQHYLITDSSNTHPESLLRSSDHPTLTSISFYLLYSFSFLALFLCATATITYSVYHGFFGRPVKLVSTLKSLSNSFLRLLLTILSAHVILFTLTLLYIFALVLLVRGFQYLGFQFVFDPNFITIFYLISFLGLGIGFLFLQVNWALAPVVVVVESSWGLEPLRRSAYLVKGMRRLVLYLFLFFGGLSSLMVWASWETDMGSGLLRALMFVLQTVSISALVMLLLLLSVAANTVVYMYAKAFHGELAREIAEEFATEYVSLPFDEEKVPFVVSVVPA